MEYHEFLCQSFGGRADLCAGLVATGEIRGRLGHTGFRIDVDRLELNVLCKYFFEGIEVMKSIKYLCLTVALMAMAGSCLASAVPMGSLESEGSFEIRAAGEARFVRISQPDYTWFSGDSIRVRSGVAVLNLRNGGGIGFEQASSATVSIDDDGRLSADLLGGRILYALPDASRGLHMQVGAFSLSTTAPGVQRLNVSSGDGFVGTVERLGDGNVKVAVRSGALYVVNGDMARYEVSAGEAIGLLDLPPQNIQAQNAAAAAPIEIEAPDEVGTREEFKVLWATEQPAQGDYIVVSKSGAQADEFESVINTDEGQELEFTAPGTPGEYEIRYVDGQTGTVQEFVFLDVVERRGLIAAGSSGSTGLNKALAVAAGAGVVYIIAKAIDDDDDDPEPVSP